MFVLNIFMVFVRFFVFFFIRLSCWVIWVCLGVRVFICILLIKMVFGMGILILVEFLGFNWVIV